MNTPKRTMTRRKFLTIAGTTIGATALCATGAYAGLNTYGIDFAENEYGKENQMSKTVLVAYASKCGSTGEVAQAVGQVLSAAGARVDVRRVQDVRNLDGYDAVVIGSAARMGKLLSEAVRFATRNKAALRKIPAAYFTTGVTMKKDTPETRAMATGFLKPLVDVQPTQAPLGLFAGKVDYDKLEPLFRFGLSFTRGQPEKMGEMAEGDFRDWDAIRAWSQELVPTLLAA